MLFSTVAPEAAPAVFIAHAAAVRGGCSGRRKGLLEVLAQAVGQAAAGAMSK